MGLLDQIVAERNRRALSTIEKVETDSLRRDTSTAIDGNASLDEKKSVPSIISGRFNTGVWKNVIGGTGRGIEATGVGLQDPRRELTVKEYQERTTPFRALKSSVSDAEKPYVDESLRQIDDPSGSKTEFLDKQMDRSMTDLTYSGPTSTITGKPLSVTEGTAPKAYRAVNFEEMNTLEQNAQIAKNYIGKKMVTGGESTAEFADKVLKNNPQWELPEHLQGRGVLESLKAEDLSIDDKATMFIGGIAEQTPQILSTLGLTLLGGLVGGIPGAIAGAGIGLGGNYFMETGHVYEDIKKNNPKVSEEDAASVAMSHGLMSTALEMAPIANLMNNIPGLKKALKDQTLKQLLTKPSLAKRAATAVATQGITEGVTEGFQEISANAAKAVFEQNPDLFQGVDESMFMGFVMGALTGGFGSIATHKSAIKKHNEEKLNNLNSEQLITLAKDPELMSREGVSLKEVTQALDQVSFLETLSGISSEGQVYETSAGTTAEQAARMYARIRNPLRADNIAKVRKANLTDEHLEVLRNDPKALKQYNLTPELVQNIIDERADEKASLEHFKSILDAAPNDNVREGILDTLQGEYYKRMTRVIEARGKASIPDAVEGKVPTKKQKTKPAKMEDAAEIIAEETQGTTEDKYAEVDNTKLTKFQEENLKRFISEIPEAEEDIRKAHETVVKDTSTWEKEYDNAQTEEARNSAAQSLKSTRALKKAIEEQMDKRGLKRANISSKSARIESEEATKAKTLDSKENAIQDDLGSETNEKITWDNIKPGQVVTLYRGTQSQSDDTGEWWTTDRTKAEKYGDVTELKVPSEYIGKKAARGHNGNDEFVFQPGDVLKSQKTTKPKAPVTRKEVESKVAELLGGVPEFMKVSEELDPVVSEVLKNRKGSALKSQKPALRNWSHRFITQFAGLQSSNFKSRDQWLDALKTWTTDKTGKDGNIIPGSAQMPRPVQEEIEFSGLKEWLESKSEDDTAVSQQDVIKYIESYSKLRMNEQVYGKLKPSLVQALGAYGIQYENDHGDNHRNLSLPGKSQQYREHVFNLPRDIGLAFVLRNIERNTTVDKTFSSLEELQSYVKRLATAKHAFFEEFESLPVAERTKIINNSIEKFFKEFSIEEVFDEVGPLWEGGHFGGRNNIMFVRADLRTATDNTPVFFINELQSDAHTEARHSGYRDPYTAKVLEGVLENTTNKLLSFLQRDLGISEEAAIEVSGYYMHIFAERGSAKLPDVKAIRDTPVSILRKSLINQVVYSSNAPWTVSDLQKVSDETIRAIADIAATAIEFSSAHSSIPSMPFRSTWYQVALKRMIQQAIFENREFVAWAATPEQIKVIEKWPNLHITKDSKGKITKATVIFRETSRRPNESIEDFIERESRVNKNRERLRLLDFERDEPFRDTLDVTPIVRMYTETLPKYVEKALKKYGVKMEPISLQNYENTIYSNMDLQVHGFRITPELLEANKEGLPLPSKQDEVVQGAYHEGQIHLATNAIESVEDVKGLVVHEGGHWLRRNDKEYQTKYQELVNRFNDIAMNPGDSAESAAVKRAWRQALADRDVVDNDILQEEALMYFLQDQANENLSLWKKFVNAIKQWLHRTFGMSVEKLKMSGREMADVIIYDLRQASQERQAEAAEAEALIEEATLAAKKREDIKEVKSEADVILDSIFNKPVGRKASEQAYIGDEISSARTIATRSTNPNSRKIGELISDIVANDFPEGTQAFTRQKHEQTTSWLSRLLSSPEYYFMKDSTAKRILDIAIEKNDNKFSWKAKVEGDFIVVVEEVKRRNPKAYDKANKYLVNTDKSGIGFFMRQNEDGSWDVYNPDGDIIKNLKSEKSAAMYLMHAEQQDLKAKRWNRDARRVVLEARRLTDRGFNLTIEDMRRQIASAKENGIPEPTMVFIDDEGSRSDIALSEAIAMMGDLRGTYFPRERQAKEFSLQAKGEGLENSLHTFDVFIPGNVKDTNSVSKLKKLFNANTPLGRKLRELEAQGYTEFSVTPVKSPAGMVFDVPGLLMSMDALLTAADEKLTEEDMLEADKMILKAASEQLSLRIADLYKAKGMLTSRMRRSETLWEGYEEDALKALTSYAQRVSTGAAMRETARQMLLTFTGRDVSWKQFQAENPEATYTEYRKYTKRKAINPVTQKKLYEDVRTYMSYVLKPDTTMDRAVGYVKALAVLKFLGLRLSSAAINTTNMALAVPATIAAHTGLDISTSWKYVGEAASKYALYRLEQLSITSSVSRALQRGIKALTGKTVLTKEDRRIFGEISRRGWDEPQFNHDAARVLQDKASKWMDNTLKVSMYFFGQTEKANRAMTIFAAYKAHKKARPNRSETMYLRLAQHSSNRAHGIYGKAAKPWAVQKVRLLDIPYTFQKFQHNYILNMVEIGVKGYEEKHKLKALKNVMYLLTAPAILAGTGASLVSKFAFFVLGATLGLDDPEEDFYRWLDEHFGEGEFVSRAARHGVTGALAHINLRGSLQMNFAVPTNLEELAGAPGGVAMDLYESAVHFSHQEWAKGFEKALPTAFGSGVKAYRESTEGVTTKNYAPVFYGNERLTATGLDAAIRYLSFNPSRLSAIRERQWRELKVNQAFTERRSEIKRQINKMASQDTWTEEEWASVYNKIREYNETVHRTHDRYEVIYITDDWVRNAIRSSYVPEKRERNRIIPEGN